MSDLIDDADFDEGDDLYDENDDQPDYTDFDAFFDAEVRKVEPATLRLYDIDYTLPVEAPLSFSLIEERLRAAEGIEPLRQILTPVFGPEALDHWITQGISERRLGIVLIWSAANMRKPGSCSIEQAIDQFEKLEAQQGKAAVPANRAARRHGSGGPSSRTGRSSRQT